MAVLESFSIIGVLPVQMLLPVAVVTDDDANGPTKVLPPLLVEAVAKRRRESLDALLGPLESHFESHW